MGADMTPDLGWRQWRRMWLVQAAKLVLFLPVVALWLVATPLKMAVDEAADWINAAYVSAYNADRRRAFGRQPRRPGSMRPTANCDAERGARQDIILPGSVSSPASSVVVPPKRFRAARQG